MPFEAETKSSEAVYLDENDILWSRKTGEQLDYYDDYQCPICKCTMTVRAISSPVKRAYFGGRHNQSLHRTETVKSVGKTSYKALKDKKSINDFYSRLIRKRKALAKKTSRRRHRIGHRSPVLSARTLLTLGEALRGKAPDEPLEEGSEILVGDFLVAESTVSLYGGQIDGLRLVRAEFHQYWKSTRMFSFDCPSVDGIIINIRVKVIDDTAWLSFTHMFRHKGMPVYILAKFRKNFCRIYNKNQVALIK